MKITNRIANVVHFQGALLGRNQVDLAVRLIPGQPGEIVHRQSKPNCRSEYILFTGKCDSATMK